MKPQTLFITVGLISVAIVASTLFHDRAAKSKTTESNPERYVVTKAESIEPRTNITVFFYNVVDLPGSVPYMSIHFAQIPKKAEKKVDIWYAEIDQKTRDAGGVYEASDYKAKVHPVLRQYMRQFRGSGAIQVYAEFPRLQERPLILHDAR